MEPVPAQEERPDPLLPTGAVAALLGLSVSTIRRMAERYDAGEEDGLEAEQRLPGPRGGWLFRLSVVERYCDVQEAP